MTHHDHEPSQASSTSPTSKALSEETPVTLIREPENALASTTLTQLPENIQEACARAQWAQLMPVQALALPYLLARRDLMVQSRTGSGKTGTYVLPLLQQLSAEKNVVQALVMVPTRELAVQVEREAKTLFAGTGLDVVAVYGGVGYGKQNTALRSGAQLVVGTPGRVLDHLLRRSLTLDHVRTLIFDEADRMLSIGFYPDMKEVQRYLPKRNVSTCLFSATYPPHVLQLAEEFMTNPALLSLSEKQVHVPQMQHLYCLCKAMDKDRALIRLIEKENPASAIIFCNTKANVHYVTEVLKGFGYNADELSADLSQSKRERVLAKMSSGSLRFLVATDVAARGIDIPALSHVFLYEPPGDHEIYIHRAGRTGRAGAAGTVISLVDVMQKLELERIAKHYAINLAQKELPSDADVAKVVGQRLSTLLEARYRTLTGLEKERVKRFRYVANIFINHDEQKMPPLEEVLSAEEGQDILLAMLLDAAYQESLGSLPSWTQRSGGSGGPARSGDSRGSSSSRQRNKSTSDASKGQRSSRSRKESAESADTFEKAYSNKNGDSKERGESKKSPSQERHSTKRTRTAQASKANAKDAAQKPKPQRRTRRKRSGDKGHE